MTRTANYGIRKVEATRRSAFTLLELLLAMAILTMMIAVSAPKLASFFHGRALDSEARRLLAMTRQGQSRAASEGVPMELWVDAEQRRYGLEAEDSYIKDSYNNSDPKAVTFDLDKDVKIEVLNRAAKPSTTTILRDSATPVSTASVAPINLKHPNLPTIRFLPDGSISEASPQTLQLIDRDGASFWLTLSRNRLNYEIRNTQPN
jgi:prepilin-type N-terminal cleavage/methylation domain-containing protein